MTDLATHIAAWRDHPHLLPAVRLVIMSFAGSTPRETGAAMIVDRSGTSGTIGGGQLELEAINHARALLEAAPNVTQPWRRDRRTWPLGPGIGQCCGGTVQLLFEVYDRASLDNLTDGRDLTKPAVLARNVATGHPARILSTSLETKDLPHRAAQAVIDILDGRRPLQATAFKCGHDDETYFIEPLRRPRTPLFVYGAGHVGRAIVKIIADLDFDVHWVDTHKERFPEDVPANVTTVIAREPALVTRAAPSGAFHLILTYSHAMDLTICHAALARPVFGYLGLIGSATKRVRFLKRLHDAGVSEAALDRLTCPIGVSRYRNKSPAAIAISVAAQLIEKREALEGRRLDENLHGTGQRILA
jgi:xanthine dehydrogenase accessory factor